MIFIFLEKNLLLKLINYIILFIINIVRKYYNLIKGFEHL